MKHIEFKGAQKQAVEIRNTDILVSAGAGSGKTTVLVERVLSFISANNPINIDRLLVVTFTDAAAQHMKNSIAKALINRIKENPADNSLRKQLALINKSNIMTIHSFCLMVARKFFHKIDLDPNFKVADDAEMSLLKNEILDKLFEERYTAYYDNNENPEFIFLCQIFDQRVGDENFRRAVLELHEYSRAAPNPSEWLKSCANEYLLAENIEGTNWYKYFIQYFQQKIDTVLGKAHKAVELAQYPHISPRYAEIISQELLHIEKAKSAIQTEKRFFLRKR